MFKRTSISLARYGFKGRFVWEIGYSTSLAAPAEEADDRFTPVDHTFSSNPLTTVSCTDPAATEEVTQESVGVVRAGLTRSRDATFRAAPKMLRKWVFRTHS